MKANINIFNCLYMCMCIYYFTTNPTTKTNPNKTNLKPKTNNLQPKKKYTSNILLYR